ncbi:MAG TPA: SDR family NAD(P)-dependent oxidoreductase, partial [Bacteroidales bacterium]|nr:SDR family NAD(P)-dependent oxidoreductase [Bacteroidales bacterium]
MKYGLVTGGSRGIGRAIALSISRMGYRVIINYHSNTEAAEETLRLIRAEGGDGELLPFDVSNEEDVDQALLQWEKDHPDDLIEVLVNNAGIRKDNLMIFMQNEDWHSIINTHLNGFFYTTRRLLK